MPLNAHRHRHLLGNQLWIAQGSQLNKPHSVPVVVGRPGRHMQGNAGLADTSDTGKCQEVNVVQQTGDLAEFLLPTDD